MAADTAETFITVNGHRMDWKAGMTVRDVLLAMDYRFPLLVIRVNGKLIPRGSYDRTSVPERAVMDVLHLMSGG